MATVKFIKRTSGVEVERNGITIHNFNTTPIDFIPRPNDLKFTLVFEDNSRFVFSTADIIVLNKTGVGADDVIVTGASAAPALGAAAICDKLRDEMFKQAPSSSLPVEYPATYADMQTSISSNSTTKRDFFVSADETNEGSKTEWRYNGSNLVRIGGTPAEIWVDDTTITGDGTEAAPLKAGVGVARQILASNVALANTGNTTENTVYTGTIPANSLGVNGTFEIRTTWTWTNNANQKSLRVKLNGSTIFLNQQTTSVSIKLVTLLNNRNSLTSQVGLNNGTAANGAYNVPTSADVTTYSINTGASITLTITLQCANAADTCTLQSFQLIAIG